MSLNVSGLTVARSGRAILAGLSFSAPAGAVTGLIGANGAGKSTLLHALLGLVPGTGSVRFGADDLPAMPRRDRARLAALVEQSATTEERVSVRDVVALGRIPFQSALSAAPGTEDQAVVDAALAEAGVDTFSTRLFHTLSGGEQQRVHLARALAQQPRLLLLDEPTSHLDIGAQLDLLAILRRRAEVGTTVLIALHDLNLAARACDHLVLIKEGRFVAAGSPQTVLTPANLRAAYGVDARLVPDPLTGRTLIVYDASAPSIPD